MREFVSYLERILITFSVLFNVILGGYSNQTFSARNYQWKREGKPNLVAVIDFIFKNAFKIEDHCSSSWAYWYVRKYEEEAIGK